jgi:hypothetical protein
MALGAPFEGLGADAFVALGWLLVATCVVDLVAGVMLWRGRRLGAWLGSGNSDAAAWKVQPRQRGLVASLATASKAATSFAFGSSTPAISPSNQPQYSAFARSR